MAEHACGLRFVEMSPATLSRIISWNAAFEPSFQTRYLFNDVLPNIYGLFSSQARWKLSAFECKNPSPMTFILHLTEHRSTTSFKFCTLPFLATMKFFNAFITAVFLVLLGVVGSMAQTSDQVITAIQSFTTASSNLETQITGLNAINFPTMGFVRPLTLAMISSSKLLYYLLADHCRRTEQHHGGGECLRVLGQRPHMIRDQFCVPGAH